MTGRCATLLPVAAAVGNPDPLEFSDARATEAKLKPLVEASGGAVMGLSDNADPELRSVRPGRAAGGPGVCGRRRQAGDRGAGGNKPPGGPGRLMRLGTPITLGRGWWLGWVAPGVSAGTTMERVAGNTASEHVSKQRDLMRPRPFQNGGLAGHREGGCLISLTCCRRGTPIGESNRQALKCDAGRIG